MTQMAPVEALLAVIPASGSGVDTYVNVEPLPSQKGVPFAFGGSLMGQSAMAAAATVSDTFQIYSMQSAFLRAVRGTEKVYYHVERTSDGQTFCSRTVRVTQGDSDACAYTSTVCFQRNDEKPNRNVLDYHVPMPHVGGVGPEGISSAKLQQVMDANITRSVPLLQISAKEEPFQWRPLDSPQGLEPTEMWQRSFVRSPAFASMNPHLHQSALAWLSDTYTLGAALNASPGKVGKQLRNVTMGATLTNNVSFHEPMTKVDDWMLGERFTSWGANGRAVVTQRFWDVSSGRLVFSGTQEVVIRLRDDTKL
ncbi:thioesterase-like superfamily-domain-containing protein [Nemania abortiva]|nr:thioesterase-like superfamily-domain-containing protein [Nemania abortiva]